MASTNEPATGACPSNTVLISTWQVTVWDNLRASRSSFRAAWIWAHLLSPAVRLAQQGVVEPRIDDQLLHVGLGLIIEHLTVENSCCFDSSRSCTRSFLTLSCFTVQVEDSHKKYKSVKQELESTLAELSEI